jgi:hypothetical protein
MRVGTAAWSAAPPGAVAVVAVVLLWVPVLTIASAFLWSYGADSGVVQIRTTTLDGTR